jgi:hypothetical protein
VGEDIALDVGEDKALVAAAHGMRTGRLGERPMKRRPCDRKVEGPEDGAVVVNEAVADEDSLLAVAVHVGRWVCAVLRTGPEELRSLVEAPLVLYDP